MQFLDIEDVDTHKKIKFYDLPLLEREVFLNHYLQEEQKMLEEKIAVLPELLEEIKELNTARGNVFEREGISRLDVTREYLTSTAPRLQRRSVLRSSSKSLFELVEEERERLAESSSEAVGHPQNQPSLRSSSSSSSGKGGETISPKENIIAGHLSVGAQRGDILVYKPYYWFGKRFSFGGHAGIINHPARQGMKKSDSFSIDATPEKANGVQEMEFESWCRPHYVLGLQRIIVLWRANISHIDTNTGKYLMKRARKIDFHMEIVKMTISDLSAMADEATKYIGVPYRGILTSMKKLLRNLFAAH